MQVPYLRSSLSNPGQTRRYWPAEREAGELDRLTENARRQGACFLGLAWGQSRAGALEGGKTDGASRASRRETLGTTAVCTEQRMRTPEWGWHDRTDVETVDQF